MAKAKHTTPIITPPVATPQPATPGATPDANIPVSATPPTTPITTYPAASVATIPAKLAVPTPPTFSAAGSVAVVEFNNAVTLAFADASARLNDLGAKSDDVLQAEFSAFKVWTKAKFDEVFSNLRDQYIISHPDSAADIRAAGWWKYHRFIRACNDLGILGADTLAYGVTVNHLFPAALDIVQTQATAQVKEGWAEWLKTIVPMIVRGELTREIIVASIDGQRAALTAFDAKRFPAPKATGGKARKKATGSGRKTTKAKATPSATPPTLPAPNNATPPTPPIVTPDATPPTPDATPSANNATPDATPPTNNAIGLIDVLAWMEIKGNAALLGLSLADPATPDAIVKAIYKAISPRIKAMKDSKATPDATPLAIGA